MENEFNDQLKKDLILSVGTHKTRRILSPIEVAEGFRLAEKNGLSKDQIAEMVLLQDVSMINKFLSLLSLSPKIKHLVDWGQDDSSIAFSTASIIAELDSHLEEEKLAEACIKHKLTKNEVRQIIQVKRRTKENIEVCIINILKTRPKIIQKFVFIGAIINENTKLYLDKLSQKERDKLFFRILLKHLKPQVKWSAKLGNNQFSLVGGVDLNQEIKSIAPEFEKTINQWLDEGTRV